MSEQAFDYIIVGSGSAGCVMADRLSAAGASSVLVLEAGGPDSSPWVKLPLGYGKTFFDAQVNWKLQTQPQAALQGRSIYVPRGCVVGGSSSINAMVYCRGLPHDFDDWAAMGNQGWSWMDVRPVFERLERRVDAQGKALSDHGGKLFVSDVLRELHPLTELFFSGSQQAGLPYTEDFNGPQPEGVGRYHINTRNGLRWSSADAYLRPALKRRNVSLQTRAQVGRVLFDGKRAAGVSYRQGGAARTVHARRAVLLCAGAVHSPQLLQLSGVGPAALLQRLGIPVVQDMPAVGANLQDHLAMSYDFMATQPTLNNVLSSTWGKLRLGLQFLFMRSGPLSISVNQVGGFVKSSPDLPYADMQLYCNPITYSLSNPQQGSRITPHAYPGFILCFQPCRPQSRGVVSIASPDVQDAPQIEPNYLSHPADIDAALAGARLILRLSQTPDLLSLIKRPMGPDLRLMNEAQMLDDFRARAGSCYHPVGTCAMGPNADKAVVDRQLRVHGLQNLYVVDASAFPTVT